VNRSMLALLLVNACATTALLALAALAVLFGWGAFALAAVACGLAGLVASEVAS